MAGVLSGCLGSSFGVPPSVCSGRVRCCPDRLLCWWSGCVLRAGRVVVGGSVASGVCLWCPFRIAPATVSLSVSGLGVRVSYICTQFAPAFDL